jgi:hypothetical protein
MFVANRLFWGKKVVFGLAKYIWKAVTDTPLMDANMKVGARGEYIDNDKNERNGSSEEERDGPCKEDSKKGN